MLPGCFKGKVAFSVTPPPPFLPAPTPSSREDDVGSLAAPDGPLLEGGSGIRCGDASGYGEASWTTTELKPPP